MKALSMDILDDMQPATGGSASRTTTITRSKEEQGGTGKGTRRRQEPDCENTKSPPTKRIRLSDVDSHASIEIRVAHEDTILEVDVMMLDYLSYQSLEEQLAPKATRNPPRSLSSTHSFLESFQACHPSYRFDDQLRFRILLLKLVTIMANRMTQTSTTPSADTLADLRQANTSRALRWMGSVDRLVSASYSVDAFDDPTSLPHPKELARNRSHFLQEMDIDANSDVDFYGTTASTSLLDILPLFVQVTALRCTMLECSASEAWLEMAAEFMLLACLEQYLVYGATGTDSIDEAFAWGARTTHPDDAPVVSNTERQATDDTDALYAVFHDPKTSSDSDSSNPSDTLWTEIKTSHLDQLFPSSSSFPQAHPDSHSPADNDTNSVPSLKSHLETLSGRYPLSTFTDKILSFLSALAQSIPAPVLVQLERGNLDGMTGEETREFLTEVCGLGNGWERDLFTPATSS